MNRLDRPSGSATPPEYQANFKQRGIDMLKKTLFGLLLFLTLFSLAACGAGQAASSQETVSTSPQNPGEVDARTMTVEMKLAAGTLMLEDTELAVDAEEAANLLPLWKAVNTLSVSDTATQEEIQALYDQIQDTMTDEQIQAIEQMELNAEEMTALRDKLGIETEAFGGGPAGFQDLSEDERATRVAQIQSQNPDFQGGFPGGGPGGGGNLGPPPDGGAAFPGGSNVQRTPDPAQQGSRRNLGMNRMFLEPLIEMLRSRVGS